MSSFKRRSQEATIPAASSFLGGGRGVRKLGRLSKLCPRGWLLGTCCWKRRFCVLDGTKLYYYDNENSTGQERSCGVLSLDYFDVCEEGKRKDKRASNIFLISSSVRGIFDLHQRHTFAADTLPEMNEWIHHIRAAIAEAHNKRKRRGNESPSANKALLKTRESPPLPNTTQITSPEQETSNSSEPKRLYTPTKNRNRGPKGRRLPQRKSLMPSRGRDVDDGPVRANSMSALECFADDDIIRKDAWLDIASESRRSASHDVYKYSSSEESLVPPAGGENNDITKTRTLPLNNQHHHPRTHANNPQQETGDKLDNAEAKRIVLNPTIMAAATAPQPSTRYKDLDQRMAQLEKRLEGLELEVAVSRADIATVHGQVGRVQKEADRATIGVAEMRETSQMHEGEMLKVMKEIKELFVDASKMKTESEVARQEFLRLKSECQDALAELKNLHSVAKN